MILIVSRDQVDFCPTFELQMSKRNDFSYIAYIHTPPSMGVKRKRLDGAAITAGGLSEATSGPPTTIYKTGREVRDALQTGSKHGKMQGETSCTNHDQADAEISSSALVSFGTQIRVPHSKLPVPINHANVVLAQHYIGLSPGLDEIFKAWKSATEVRELRTACQWGSDTDATPVLTAQGA